MGWVAIPGREIHLPGEGSVRETQPEPGAGANGSAELQLPHLLW